MCRLSGWMGGRFLKSPERSRRAQVKKMPKWTRDPDSRADSAACYPDQIDALMRGVRYDVQVVPGTTTTLATAIAANGFTLPSA